MNLMNRLWVTVLIYKKKNKKKWPQNFEQTLPSNYGFKKIENIYCLVKKMIKHSVACFHTT